MRTTNPLVHWIFGFRAVGLGPFAMLPDLFTCVALAILPYLTVKYLENHSRHVEQKEYTFLFHRN